MVMGLPCGGGWLSSLGRHGPRVGWVTLILSKMMGWAVVGVGHRECLGPTCFSHLRAGCLGAGSQVNCGVEDGCQVDL